MKYLACDERSEPFKLFFVRLSDCEMEIYESMLDFIIYNFEAEFIAKNFCEAQKDELEGMRDSIRYVMLKYFDKDDLPDRAKDWDYDQCEEAAEY